MNKITIREVCIDSIDQAMKAERQGADRLELCSALHLDGLTPKINEVYKVIKIIQIPIKVMVRCRDGNFIYNDGEISKMEEEIDLFKSMGVQEIVTGALTESNYIDQNATRRLVNRANPMKVTFHKAIDYTDDMLGQINILSKIKGINSILTSGGAESALKGVNKINKIINKFGSRFRIIAAGSITNKNLEILSKEVKNQ
ncbi:MAG: copper homeostasis protein CutC [Candidatus Neomarinimicrobiota bacterium]